MKETSFDNSKEITETIRKIKDLGIRLTEDGYKLKDVNNTRFLNLYAKLAKQCLDWCNKLYWVKYSETESFPYSVELFQALEKTLCEDYGAPEDFIGYLYKKLDYLVKNEIKKNKNQDLHHGIKMPDGTTSIKNFFRLKEECGYSLESRELKNVVMTKLHITEEKYFKLMTKYDERVVFSLNSIVGEDSDSKELGDLLEDKTTQDPFEEYYREINLDADEGRYKCRKICIEQMCKWYKNVFETMTVTKAGLDLKKYFLTYEILKYLLLLNSEDFAVIKSKYDFISKEVAQAYYDSKTYPSRKDFAEVVGKDPTKMSSSKLKKILSEYLSKEKDYRSIENYIIHPKSGAVIYDKKNKKVEILN